MFDFAVLAIGRADEADRITAVALNFKMKGKRFAFNGHQISTLVSNNQVKTICCMATNEIKNGCGLSIDAALASNQKRRCVLKEVLPISQELSTAAISNQAAGTPNGPTVRRQIGRRTGHVYWWLSARLGSASGSGRTAYRWN